MTVGTPNNVKKDGIRGTCIRTVHTFADRHTGVVFSIIMV